MELRRRTLTGILSAVMAVALLGLAGCFGFGGQEELVLPEAKVSSPSIVRDGALTVGVDSSRAPFAGRSGDETIGIDVDVAAALAEQLGLELVLYETSGQDVSALLRDGTVDVVMGIQSDATTSAASAGSTAPFSEAQIGPYLLDGPAVFLVSPSSELQSFDPAQLSGMTIAVQEASLSAWQVGKDYGEESLLTFPSLNGAFDELSAGGVPYAAADAIVGSFLATQQYKDVRCGGLLVEPQGVYLGVATDRSELLGALTEGLRVLRDSGNLQVIVTKWLGPVSAQIVLSDQAIVSLSSGETTGVTGEEPAPDAGGTGEDLEGSGGGTAG